MSIKVKLLIILISLVSIFFSLTHFLPFSAYFPTNNIKSLIANTPDLSGIFSLPINRDSFLSVPITKSSEKGNFTIIFKETINFSGISFYFPGNLETKPSYGAENIRITSILNDSIQEISTCTISGNIKPFFECYINKPIKLSGVIIEFSKPFVLEKDGSPSSIRINDLQIYSYRKVNIFSYLSWRLSTFSYSQSAVVYLFYYLLFFLVLFII